jgi:hypothetical protein
VATPGEPGGGTYGAEIYSTELHSADPTNRSVFIGTLAINTFNLQDTPFHLIVVCG